MPDLASADPEIAPDGKTVTVKLRKGVMFSDPVDREATSADVKYAIERAYTSNVSNGYVQTYFGDVVGAPKAPGPYKEVPGIETPDESTIVFKLTKGTGAALAGALAMPISIPVPKDFAMKYDKQSPSTYGEQHAVYTGPYKVEGDAQGDVTGYKPGQQHPRRAQSAVRERRRLPPRVPGRDRVPVRQRRHRGGDEADPERREHGVGRLPSRPRGSSRRCCRPTSPSSPRCRAAGGAASRWTRAVRRSTTSTCARR